MMPRLLLAGILSLQICSARAEPLMDFRTASESVPEPWQVIQLDRDIAPTRYQVRRWDHVLGVEAHADHSMALLARPIEVDLQQTPVLCWRWRVDAPLENADMHRKSGDDYAARVYVSFSLPPESMNWITRSKLKLARLIWGDSVPDAAINYVWDKRNPVGARTPNAYTDRARMIVAESGAEKSGHWINERHNLQNDFITEFGNIDAEAVQLAVASDTDNTGEKAHAGFAGFHFVAADAHCSFR